jgi:ribonuclease H / adenosylcobalamin/alpha-ribazole phosphatase
VARRLVVEADGGSRGNPGPAAFGALVRNAHTGEVIAEQAEYIGVASNNVAEYRGVIAGLTMAREIDPDADVEVRLDSRLVVEQLSGRWRVKHPAMRELASQATAIAVPGRVRYSWVPRAQNGAADALVNQALDAAAGRTRLSAAADADPPATVVMPVPLAADVPPNKLVGWAHDLGTPTVTLLLRHGETAHTREKRFSGSGGEDPSLSADGVAQAAAAAGVLARVPGVQAVVTSPLTRARETARIVADTLGVACHVDDDIAECSFGEWEGLTFAEVEERWPQELARWLASSAVAPPGGESFDAVESRVRRSKDALVSEHAAGTVVVVSHVTPVKTFVRLALEAPSRSSYRMELAPASITSIAWFADGNASLRCFNDTAHLDGLLPVGHV